jgi:hypothetical protein
MAPRGIVRRPAGDGKKAAPKRQERIYGRDLIARASERYESPQSTISRPGLSAFSQDTKIL